MAKKKQYFWISWDLGLKGDYENLYKWIDDKPNRSCGDNMAWIQDYEYENDIFMEILSDLKSNVNFNPGDSVYVIAPNNGTASGMYIIGSRKSVSRWTGYGSVSAQTTEGPSQ